MTFIADLEKLFNEWQRESSIGQVFITFGSFFKLYTDYCNNTDTSQEELKALNKARKKKKYRAYIEEEERKQGMGLESYLITPIQRIPRYELLLMQCQKYTNSDLEDYEKLTQALDLVREVNASNNASMSTQIEADRKKQLQKIFGDKINLLLP